MMLLFSGLFELGMYGMLVVFIVWIVLILLFIRWMVLVLGLMKMKLDFFMCLVKLVFFDRKL